LGYASQIFVNGLGISGELAGILTERFGKRNREMVFQVKKDICGIFSYSGFKERAT